jgi:hypothetical protein
MLNLNFALQPNISIPNKATKPEQNNVRPNFKLINSYPCDVVSFGHKVPKNKTFFHDFAKQLRRSGQTLEEAIRTSVKEANLLGEGQNSRVYSLSGIEDYVVKVDKVKIKIGNEKKRVIMPVDNLVLTKISSVEDVFEGANMGQPIGQVADIVSVLRKQKGSEHSIKNWSYFDHHQTEITPEHAQAFLHSIEKIAQMPERTYLKFAQSIELLTQKGYKMDSINPNNLLIDHDNKEINIIDFFKKPQGKEENYENSRVDMTNSVLDFYLFNKFHSLLDEPQQKRLVSAAGKVAKKCHTAAAQTSMRQDEQTYLTFLNKVDKYFPMPDYDFREGYSRLKGLVPEMNAKSNRSNQQIPA